MAQYIYNSNNVDVFTIKSNNSSHQGAVILGYNFYGGNIRLISADTTALNRFYIDENNNINLSTTSSSSTSSLTLTSDALQLNAQVWLSTNQLPQLEVRSMTSGQSYGKAQIFSDITSGQAYFVNTTGTRKTGIDMPGNNARWYRLWSDNTHGHSIQLENSRIYFDGDLKVTANSLGSSSLGPISASNVQQKTEIKTITNGGGILIPSIASPNGSKIAATGEYEIDFNSMIIRLKLSAFPLPPSSSTSPSWSSSAWTFCTATQLFSLMGLTNYTVDKDRIDVWVNGASASRGGVVIGTARWNNPNNSNVASQQGLGSYIAYYPDDADTDGPIGMGRIYDAANPGVLGLWASDTVLADYKNGITMKITLPFKAK